MAANPSKYHNFTRSHSRQLLHTYGNSCILVIKYVIPLIKPFIYHIKIFITLIRKFIYVITYFTAILQKLPLKSTYFQKPPYPKIQASAQIAGKAHKWACPSATYIIFLRQIY